MSLDHFEVAGTQVGMIPVLHIWCHRQIERWQSSPVWRPNLIKHIELLETVQRCATKFILNNFELDYKSRLVHLNLLQLMFWFELADILFLVKCYKNPDTRMKISELSLLPTQDLHLS